MPGSHRSSSRHRRLATLVSFLLAVGGPVFAQPPSGWERSLSRMEALLQKGGSSNAWRAQTVAAEAFSRWSDEVGRDAKNRATLARFLALWAVSLQRNDDRALGRWRAAEAASLDWQETERALAPFPEKDALLQGLAPVDVAAALRQLNDPPPGSTPPEPEKLVPVSTALSARAGERGGTTKVLAVVDPAGLVERPILVETSGHLGFDVAVMDALREWVFRPASQDGKAVVGMYLLSVTLRSGD